MFNQQTKLKDFSQAEVLWEFNHNRTPNLN